MSRETYETLNQLCLIGFTDKRGKAWHYREDAQGDEPNHYPGAIPREDVERRLFDWDAVVGEITATALLESGVLQTKSPVHQAIMRSDTGDILGIFKQGYLVHQYRDWLLETVGAILDDELSIGSAGLLQNGGQAWVSVEVPENITTPSGVVFRPNLLACTSHNGTLATTFKRVVTNVVCDNTMAVGLGEKGQVFKVRHSRYSNSRLTDVRAALELVHSIGDEFAAQVEQLTNTVVSEGDWNKFLDSLTPLTDDTGAVKQGRAATLANNKRNQLTALYRHDDRVAPWNGTAWGVVQAVNTWEHHIAGASASDAKRAERNMNRAVTGGTDKLDRDTLETLGKVLTPA